MEAVHHTSSKQTQLFREVREKKEGREETLDVEAQIPAGWAGSTREQGLAL